MGDVVKREPTCKGAAKYLEIPILEDLIRYVEEGYADAGVYDDTAARAAAYGIFAHYFQPKNSFVFLGETAREDSNTDETIIRIGHSADRNAYPECRLIAEVKRYEASVIEESLERLRNIVSQTVLPPVRYWTIVIHGPEIVFYKFDEDESNETEPFYAPTRPSRHQFHLRHDADTVHEMLRGIAGSFRYN